MNISIPLKEIVLTAIKHHGVDGARERAQQIADECFAKKASVLAWIRKVEKCEITIS